MIKLYNSLLWKLTLAFLLVAITTAALVAVFIRVTSADRLSQLIVNQEVGIIQTTMANYYAENESWTGVMDVWQQTQHRSQPTVNPSTATNRVNVHDKLSNDTSQNFYGLVDAKLKVIISNNPDYPTGATIPQDLTNGGTPIRANGEQVGTIITPPMRPRFNPEENLFLHRTTEALIYASLGSILFAVVIGALLARTLIRPLHALTQASQSIAHGELEQSVEVKSKDEIGQLAQAFNTMSHEVARVNQLRRQMTADIAHDLRTPLTVIAGYVESMRDGILQPTTERLSLIFTEIERLQHLVNDLRILSQADAGELPLHPQPIEPNVLIERAAAPFSHSAETQGITLKVKAENGLPKIYVDEARMIQVFSNLVSNALRYTQEHGIIQLSARRSNGKIEFCVWDNGMGIAAEELSLIFNRFYRVDKSRTDTGETGLGLAISKALVEAHKGSMRVESQLNEFTAFYIDLPI
jgi:signal transduction histidine kinase